MATDIRETVHALCATYYGHNLPDTAPVLQWYAHLCAEEPDEKKRVQDGLDLTYRTYGPVKRELGTAFLFESGERILVWFKDVVEQTEYRLTALRSAYDYTRRDIAERRSKDSSYDCVEGSLRAVRSALTRAQSNTKNIEALFKCYDIIVKNMPEATDAADSTKDKLIATANTNTGCVTTLTAELERLPQTSQI